VGACLSYEFLTADPALSAGDGDATMHSFGLTAAMPLSPSLLLGTTSRYVRFSETMSEAMPVDGSRKGAWLGDAGLILRATQTLSLGVTGYNLIGGDDHQFGRALGGGIAVTPTTNLLIAADARYDWGRDSGRYGGGIEYLFTSSAGQNGFPIRAGYLYDSGSNGSLITAGLGWVTQRLAVDVGARFQVAGEGNELLVQGALRLFLPN